MNIFIKYLSINRLYYYNIYQFFLFMNEMSEKKKQYIHVIECNKIILL